MCVAAALNNINVSPLEAAEEFQKQPALSNTGLTEHRHELTFTSKRSAERALQNTKLLGPSYIRSETDNLSGLQPCVDSSLTFNSENWDRSGRRFKRKQTF